MREGAKPAEVHSLLPAFLRHRIIIPIYIPRLDGYYKNALEILRLCLDSLRSTIAGKASVTLVSNNAAREVIDELERYSNAGWIDQIVLNRVNRGKVDAVNSAAKGAFEEFITISDCDVLFLHGWLEAMEEIFSAFPECGFASPTPNPRSAWYHTSATILGGVACGALKFEKVVPDIDLDRFARSIGWPDMFDGEYRRAQMVLGRNGVTACIGAGHFVCTLRKQVIAALPCNPSRVGAAGNSEETWIDMPPDAVGFWRLSTTRAYAYHMGNIPERWMHEELDRCRDARCSAHTPPAPPSAFGRPWTTRVPWALRRKLAGAIRFGISRFGSLATAKS